MMAREKENPGARAGAAGAKREKHSAPWYVTSAGEGRFTGFKSLKWERNVLDVIAAARTRKITDNPTFLVAAVAMDMACFAGQDGRLFRAADDAADAVGASASNVREARDWLCRAGLAEKIKVANDQIAEAGRMRTRRKKGREAQDFQLLFVDVQEAIFRLNAGGNTGTYSAPMQADNTTPISAPMQALFSAPMGAATVEEPIRARARANARPAPVSHIVVHSYDEADVLIEKADAETGADGRARDRAPEANGAFQENHADPAKGNSNGRDTCTASGYLDRRPKEVTLDDLDRLDAERWGAAAARSMPAPADGRPSALSYLAGLGVGVDDLDNLREAMRSAAGDGAAHPLSERELAAAFIAGFAQGDPDQRLRVVENVKGVLNKLSGRDFRDFQTPAEQVEDLCAAFRAIAAKARPALGDGFRPAQAVVAFAVAVGFPNAVPAPPIHIAVQTPKHSASHAPDGVADAVRDLSVLFGARLPRPLELARDLLAGLGQSDARALDRAVEVVNAVANPGDWPTLCAITNELCGLGAGADLQEAATDAAVEAEDDHGF